MNVVILIGRLGRDPELKYTPAGKAVASTSIAVDRGGKTKEDGTRDVDWINLVAWEGRAEYLANYCAKGDMVAIEGKLRPRDWVDQEGQKHHVTEVLVSQSQRLTKKNGGEQSEGGRTTGGAETGDESDYDPFADEG